MAGVTSETGMSDVLDVLTVVMLDIPERQLQKWRQFMDRATVVAQAKAGTLDRATWGLQPHQIEQQQAAMRTLGRNG